MTEAVPTGRAPSPLSRRDLGPVMLVLAIWALATALARPWGDFPANDDWVYGLSVEALLRDGRFSLPSPATANVWPQVYWGALFCRLFGFSYDALRASTLVLAAAALALLYAATREVGGSRRTAGIVTLALALDPMFFQLAATFMTDVPFTALTGGALWSFARWARTDRSRWLALAIGVALAGVLLRQFSLLFAVGFAAAYAVRARGKPAAVALVLLTAAVGAGTHLLYQHWLLATGRTPLVVATSLREVVPGLGVRTVVRILANMLLQLPYVGLIVTPAYLAAGLGQSWATARARPHRTAFALAGLVLAQLAPVLKLHVRMPYLFNVLTRFGVGPLTLRDTFILGRHLPAAPPGSGTVWTALMLLGIAAGAWLVLDGAVALAEAAANARRRTPAPEDTIATAAVAITAMYLLLTAALLLALGAFDRYLLALAAPLTLTIVARACPDAPRAPALALAFVLLSGAWSIGAAHDYFAWQRARLSATTALERAGVPRAAVDGGYEYNGRYLYRADYRRTPGKSYWWVADDRYVIASGPLPGYTVQSRWPYPSWIAPGRRSVLVLLRR